MNTASVKRDLLDGIKADSEYRHAWNLENVYTGICFQIRAVREQRGWSQAELGQQAKMAQERISILEDPNAETKPTLNTLLRLANACDVGLDVRFVPFKTVIERSTQTDLKGLEVSPFAEELPQLEREIEEEVRSQEIERAISNLVNIGDYKAKLPPVEQHESTNAISVLAAPAENDSRTQQGLGTTRGEVEQHTLAAASRNHQTLNA